MAVRSCNYKIVDEVRFYVNQLKNSEAPAIDGIKPIVLKNMPNSIFNIISKVFNWCLKFKSDAHIKAG